MSVVIPGFLTLLQSVRQPGCLASSTAGPVTQRENVRLGHGRIGRHRAGGPASDWNRYTLRPPSTRRCGNDRVSSAVRIDENPVRRENRHGETETTTSRSPNDRRCRADGGARYGIAALSDGKPARDMQRKKMDDPPHAKRDRRNAGRAVAAGASADRHIKCSPATSPLHRPRPNRCGLKMEQRPLCRLRRAPWCGRQAHEIINEKRHLRKSHPAIEMCSTRWNRMEQVERIPTTACGIGEAHRGSRPVALARPDRRRVAFRPRAYPAAKSGGRCSAPASKRSSLFHDAGWKARGPERDAGWKGRGPDERVPVFTASWFTPPQRASSTDRSGRPHSP